ncbi:hypothetical protein X777_09848 [Ooceraea biroi]|uniref:Uncharacterized protein n=1 Tax=Ooceraea biroi TaxID=2015173 RepID=A0A026W8Z7_OOCBI|nr:hypothetical protein X777_09848 [Ooceraea biroi]
MKRTYPDRRSVLRETTLDYYGFPTTYEKLNFYSISQLRFCTSRFKKRKKKKEIDLFYIYVVYILLYTYN